MQADFIVRLGEKAQVPIISFSATSPSVSSFSSPYFIRATQNDSSQVKVISAIIQAFGWREVVPIYVDNEFGEGIVPFLTDALEEINARVPYRSVINALATDDQITAELYKLMTMQTRVFVVHMSPSLCSRLFTKANELGMMNKGYVWIITDAVANELTSVHASVIESMQGVIGVKPYVPKTKDLENFTTRWKLKFQQENANTLNEELNVFGLWAYDSATALAMAVEKSRITNAPFQKPNTSRNSTDLEFGVSLDGPELLRAILNTSFKGLSGDFQIVNGKLKSPAYQIINVIGKGEKGIGFWTKENGILKDLSFRSANSGYSISKANFGTILWPGDSTTVPKGWVIPTNGKKLKIGVPMKSGFNEFIKVTRDFSTNTTVVSGFCIDVFEAVMAALPYAVPYEYVPFATPDGKSAGDYNELVYQVFLGNFDAVAGDTTITANRSLYVDFTLPYTETGVVMVVPINDNDRKNGRVFLKPLTGRLWLTIFCYFVFIGFVIWVLEHRINEDFRGPPWYQVGLIFWFSFSIVVFSQKERIVSNLARFVLIIWFLVVVIMTQSYAASLASMLTVQSLEPSRDFNELLKNKDFVGYKEGSFVRSVLRKLNFDEDRLVIYKSTEECDDLLSKGSGKGGIAAAFDGIPYMKLFLSNPKYCKRYTIGKHVYKADGFGFVFPIGSPLVPDVSRAVLKVTESEKMFEIERALYGTSTCPDSNTAISPFNSLGLGHFWVLFVITAAAAILALLIFLAQFMHKNWDLIRRSNLSLKDKITILARSFDGRDYNSHTFRKHELRDAGEVSANMICPQSPHSTPMLQSPRTEPPSPSLSNNTEQSPYFRRV